tara:strand:+ start:607 stop:1776 length:1170 start_codon:yes stop_codon:yes gene_type:complete
MYEADIAFSDTVAEPLNTLLSASKWHESIETTLKAFMQSRTYKQMIETYLLHALSRYRFALPSKEDYLKRLEKEISEIQIATVDTPLAQTAYTPLFKLDGTALTASRKRTRDVADMSNLRCNLFNAIPAPNINTRLALDEKDFHREACRRYDALVNIHEHKAKIDELLYNNDRIQHKDLFYIENAMMQYMGLQQLPPTHHSCLLMIETLPNFLLRDEQTYALNYYDMLITMKICDLFKLCAFFKIKRLELSSQLAEAMKVTEAKRDFGVLIEQANRLDRQDDASRHSQRLQKRIALVTKGIDVNQLYTSWYTSLRNLHDNIVFVIQALTEQIQPQQGPYIISLRQRSLVREEQDLTRQLTRFGGEAKKEGVQLARWYELASAPAKRQRV